ncbi:MAG TPA: galactose oxidase-like domain-containing protein [Gemmatimonadales bacterium]|nr:galactose oxidase-like domain-containing protein [Gemmatimonadales bacterium]
MFRQVILLAFVLAIAACEPVPGPRTPPRDVPIPADDADDAPLRLAYVCGNRYVIINAQQQAVTVRYEVQGTEERGERRLPAAISGDPPFSEVQFTVASTNPVALYLGDSLLVVRTNEGTPCEPVVGGPELAVAATADAGQWSGVSPWPIVALHVSLLYNGKVLSWGKYGDPYLWDPATGNFQTLANPYWLFCAGHSLLADGRVLVAGGHISDDHGLPDAAIFSPGSGSWTKIKSMKFGRWYPTNTTLANGEVLVMGGRNQSGNMVTTAEVWTGSAWRALTTAKLRLPYYPRTWAAPNGRVFYAGEQKVTRYLNTAGTGSWDTVAFRKFGIRDYGSAVMYEPGKILYAGGGRTTRTAEIIDLNKATPAWQYTGSMAYPRRHLNATVLPTGEVLVTGGSRGTSFNDVGLAVRVAEIWNPATGVWTQLASNAVNRVYHSASLLLPDGRVLHTGSGDAVNDGVVAPDEKNFELFSPPYLFKGARPTISSAPSSAAYRSTFSVGTPDPTAIGKVSLIALGSVTHAMDQGQRFLWLSFTRESGALRITAPANRNVAPPGYYMLFVLNGSGVPSVAKMIKLQ